MSRRYLGGFITANPTIPTASSASGAWTLSQQNQYASTWPFGGPFSYIEDVFSTWLYTGNGSTQTITNNIDLSGKGGLVWLKSRNDTYPNVLSDTNRGTDKWLLSNGADAEFTNTNNITSFTSTGFTVGNAGRVNASTINFASWTFREQAKFFDVVTYTGNGVAGRTVAHNLGSVPGMIIVKRTDSADDWFVYHRSITASGGIKLNLADAKNDPNNGYWNSTEPTSTVFTVGNNSGVNANGGSFVAYLFAHNAGGFGLSGNDNVISCGSFTSSLSSGGTINLGYEPQYIMIKNATSASQWIVVDSMRGIPTVDAKTARLFPNLSSAEDQDGRFNINATGFSYLPSTFADGDTIIYMAIRRGPMKTPTSGTEVFQPVAYAGDSVYPTTFGTLNAVDMCLNKTRDAAEGCVAVDRLRDARWYLQTAATTAETNMGNIYRWKLEQTGIIIDSDFTRNQSGRNYVNYLFRRAPGFFDVVCYTGTGSATTQTHNLGVAPELMIVKKRNATGQWAVYSQATGNTNVMYLEESGPTESKPNMWNSTTPTASVFSIGTEAAVNTSAATYVAYLFATCAGVSKVGSYTGTGATQTINCGFTGGARFVLIKRTDFTGSYSSNPWYVWDTARGMVSGTDPRLALNSTAAEINNNWVYTATNGFQIVTTDATVNASGGSYIYLAIA